jgi:hypothetical protein
MTNVLADTVLVLNKGYSPIAITSVKRAIHKIVNERAEIITVEDGAYCNYDFTSWAEVSELKREFEELGIHEELIGFGASFTFVVPRVIRMLYYEKIPPCNVKLNRRNIYARDKNICQYCGKRFSTKDLSVDHVIPKSKGGRNIWTNLVCSCITCNARKANKTLERAGLKLIRKPYAPKANPAITIKIGHDKYASWKHFLSEQYWNIELED